jgi:SAM-dependent methyltransferase
MTKQYCTNLPDGSSFCVGTAEGVFQPTFTSELCLKAFWKENRKVSRVLDLGCGCGLVGLAVTRSGMAEAPVCASDLSSVAVRLTAENAQRLGIACDCRAGSLFEPWAGETFDVIIDDVSGIAEPVARVSPWFGEVIPCSSGADGSDLTRAVLREVGLHLRPNGVLFFPVISLSSRARILGEARTRFADVSLVASQSWGLPDQMRPQMNFLRKLQSEGSIDFREILGVVVCSTEIYCARFPIQ